VNVTTGADCDWTASSSVPWIAVTVGLVGSGPGTVRYDVAPNSTPRLRSGIVRIADQVHTVRQSRPARCVVDLDPSRVDVPAEGVVGSIAVTAPDGCPWTVTSPVPWIVITSAGGGDGDGVVQYLVDVNPGGPRRARIAIGGRALMVRQ
jgi:hypothetical protein